MNKKRPGSEYDSAIIKIFIFKNEKIKEEIKLKINSEISYYIKELVLEEFKTPKANRNISSFLEKNSWESLVKSSSQIKEVLPRLDIDEYTLQRKIHKIQSNVLEYSHIIYSFFKRIEKKDMKNRKKKLVKKAIAFFKINKYLKRAKQKVFYPIFLSKSEIQEELTKKERGSSYGEREIFRSIERLISEGKIEKTSKKGSYQFVESEKESNQIKTHSPVYQIKKIKESLKNKGLNKNCFSVCNISLFGFSLEEFNSLSVANQQEIIDLLSKMDDCKTRLIDKINSEKSKAGGNKEEIKIVLN